MSKIVDITDKLSFDENPKLTIKGKKLEVNADATTVLKIMGIIGDGEGVSVKEISDVYQILFDEKARKVIDGFKLSIDDFKTLVSEAVNLVIGEGDQGEQ